MGQVAGALAVVKQVWLHNKQRVKFGRFGCCRKYLTGCQVEASNAGMTLSSHPLHLDA